MSIGIIGSGAIGTAFARTLAPRWHRSDHLQQSRPGLLERLSESLGRGSGPARANKPRAATSCWSRLTGANCRRRCRAAGLEGPPHYRRQQSDRGAAVQAGQCQGPRVERVVFRVRTRGARGESFQPSARRNSGRRSQRERRAGACCSIRATTRRQRRRWRPSSTRSALPVSILDRSRSAANSPQFPGGTIAEPEPHQSRVNVRCRRCDPRRRARFKGEHNCDHFLMAGFSSWSCRPARPS